MSLPEAGQTGPPPALLSALLAREGRRQGDEVRFRCVFPEGHKNADANPSARYNTSKSVWVCDVCGGKGGWLDLCRRLDIPLPSSQPTTPPKRVAVYEYRTESGEPLRRKVRWEPGFKGRSKSFTWERPDGQGGWAPAKGDGNPRRLYRSEDLPRARSEERRVLVVEGEKDADRAKSLDLVAVCNPEGAKNWRDKYSEQLQGLPVLVVADRDQPGRQHARQVAACLHEVAGSPRVLELPGDGIKDFSDWVDAQLAKGIAKEDLPERLEELEGKAPAWAPTDGLAPAEKEERAGDSKPTQSEILLGLADSAGIELFKDQEGKGFARLPTQEHCAVHAVQSPAMRLWLRKAYFDAIQKSPSTQALQDALGTLEARALFDGPEHPVFIRVGVLDGRVFIDLGCPQWKVVEISASGWKIVTNAPVRFRRTSTTRALPEPIRGGSVEALRSLINLQDDRSFILLVAFLVTSFAPDRPFPALVLTGEQGSAKSSLARMIVSLIDPQAAPLISPPRNEEDLIIAATSRRLIAIDNISGVRPWLSDALCRISTGGGLSKRRLYSDAEEVVLSVQKPVVLTGIDEVVGRPDLVDRSLLLHLSPISDQQRRTEHEMAAEWDRVLPGVLGALFQAVSGALLRMDDVRLPRVPRMADFARWVVAAEPDLPWPSGAFLEAYESNRSGATEASLEADEVADALLRWVSDHGDFQGTATELLAHLDALASDRPRGSKHWPTSPQGLSIRLTRVAPFLRKVGIEISRDRAGASGRRVISLTQTTPEKDRQGRQWRQEAQLTGRPTDDSAAQRTKSDNPPSAEKARSFSSPDETDDPDDFVLGDSEVESDPEAVRL